MLALAGSGGGQLIDSTEAAVIIGESGKIQFVNKVGGRPACVDCSFRMHMHQLQACMGL